MDTTGPKLAASLQTMLSAQARVCPSIVVEGFTLLVSHDDDTGLVVSM